jgi:YesN/AraC family two-component response regulator
MSNIDKAIECSQELTLLYVEDNQDAREMTTMILEDFFDNLLVAINGEDAYKKFIQHKIDIVITDISMPKLNGLELCKKIRETNKNIPLVILSAHNQDNFSKDIMKYGVNEHLLKPIDLEELAKIIYKLTKHIL